LQIKIIDRFNRHPFWRRETAACGKRLTVPTFDRWLYVQLHAVKWMGRDVPWLAEHIRPGMTVIDVGANIGYYTLVFADLVGPSGRVIAFEPDPDLFNAAVENVRLNGKAGTVQLHNCALGAQPAELYLQRGQVNSGDNRLHRSDPGTARSVAVRVLRLDDVLSSEKVDWIKVDVQGWECDVFEGMDQTLVRNLKTLQICFEFWPHGIRQAGRDPREVLTILRKSGYSIYRRESSTQLTDAELESYSRSAGRLTFLNLLAYRTAP
jgi:FkbM family methyltransferase